MNGQEQIYRALQETPDNWRLRLRLLEIVQEAGARDEVIRLVCEAPTPPPMLSNLRKVVDMCVWAGAPLSAQSVVATYLDQVPASPAGNAIYARLLLQTGDLERALEHYNRAVALDPQQEDARLAAALQGSASRNPAPAAAANPAKPLFSLAPQDTPVPVPAARRTPAPSPAAPAPSPIPVPAPLTPVPAARGPRTPAPQPVRHESGAVFEQAVPEDNSRSSERTVVHFQFRFAPGLPIECLAFPPDPDISSWFVPPVESYDEAVRIHWMTETSPAAPARRAPVTRAKNPSPAPAVDAEDDGLALRSEAAPYEREDHLLSAANTARRQIGYSPVQEPGARHSARMKVTAFSLAVLGHAAVLIAPLFIVTQAGPPAQPQISLVDPSAVPVEPAKPVLAMEPAVPKPTPASVAAPVPPAPAPAPAAKKKVPTPEEIALAKLPTKLPLGPVSIQPASSRITRFPASWVAPLDPGDGHAPEVHVVGIDDPFGASLVMNSGADGGPVNFFGVHQTAKKVVFAVDYSTSMTIRDKHIMVRKELAKTLMSLPEGIQYQCIFFDGTAWVHGEEPEDRTLRSQPWLTIPSKDSIGMSDSPVLKEFNIKDVYQAEFLDVNEANIERSIQIVQETELGPGVDWRRPLFMAMKMKPDAIFFITDSHYKGDSSAMEEFLAYNRANGKSQINTVCLMVPEAADQLAYLAASTKGNFCLVMDDETRFRGEQFNNLLRSGRDQQALQSSVKLPFTPSLLAFETSRK